MSFFLFLFATLLKTCIKLWSITRLFYNIQMYNLWESHRKKLIVIQLFLKVFYYKHYELAINK